MANRFFVAGCQRSGTTMLRLVLDSHPGIRCFDEAVAYDHLALGKSLNLSQQQSLMLGFKIPRFSEQLLWTEMIDSQYGRFPSFYGGEKVIFIIRDVCDVVASMLTLKAGASITWLENYAEDILRTSLEKNPHKLYFEGKLARIRQEDNYIYLLGALYWEMKNQGVVDLARNDSPIYVVSYEHVVRDPHAVLQNVMRFLGLPWSDSLLVHHQHEHKELEANGLAIGNTDPKRPIDQASVGRGKSGLRESDIKSIYELVGEMQNHLAQLEC